MKHHDPAAIRRAKIIRTIVMVFLCVLSLLPFYLMFVNGTRTSNEVKSGISFWFGSNLLENLHNFDLKQRGLGVTALGSMVNSLLVTVPATALSVYFSALTAYGIHAYDFKLKKAAWGFILAVMMVPTQVFAIGYYKFMIQLKLIDTYWPLIIPAITTPVVVFFLRQYLLGALPLEVVEAARIDGANGWQIATKIKLPNVRGAALLAMLLSIVGTIQLFNEPQIMSTADPGISKSYTPMMMAMNTSQGTITPSGDGPASAIAIVMALIAGVLAVLYTLAERKVNE